MRITEIFHSIQGEGTLIGLPMLFIRTNRCNLRCRWCDSTYTFSGGQEMTLDEIMEKIYASSEDWVCLTGGEPLLQRESVELIERAGRVGRKVLLETGGSLSLKDYANMDNLTIDMDVKTPSSGEQASLYRNNLDYLRRGDYIKFVVADHIDLAYALDFIRNGKMKFGVVLQPAWGTDMKWLAEKVLESHLNVRVLPQLHKLIWGEIPGV